MGRGRLRIYLGAAPGVGKTVAMLDEGHRRLERGADVVVGLCETHSRPHTAGLLAGLEVVPRKRLDYKGAVLDEMDTAAILARAPQIVLVDELAHTNVPGSSHEKRWQDIEELLEAGIDVISTVNIQHLESLNDAVAAITGVVQRETVPDEVVRAADQIELVDMAPEALRRRMAHGNIYRPEKVDAALANYFRLGNLSALRELALLWLADKVDAGLESYRNSHGITQAWPARERVVVALSGGPEGEVLLRRGARIASRFAGGQLLGVLVSRTDGLAGAPLSQVAELRRLTEELGGEFHAVTGEDPAAAVLDFARGVNATQVLVGASGRAPWRRALSHSLAERIIADAGDIDVHVVTQHTAGRGFATMRRRGLRRSRVVAGVVTALLLPPALTAILVADPFTSDLPLDIPIFLLATVAVAVIGGLVPAVIAAVLSSLLLNWYFVEPVGTLTVSDPENTFALLVFVLVGVLVAVIVHRNAWRTEQALAAQRESAALAELSHTLLGSTDQLPLLLQRSVDMFGVQAAAIVRRPPVGSPVVVTSVGPFDPLAVSDHEDADASHELVLQPAGLSAGQRRLFDAFAAHAGAILQRQELTREASSAAQLAKENQARTALLSAVSHDLRTPLAGIKAAIGSLRSTEVTWSAQDEEELKEVIEQSADRLEALIGNLLDLSRLQTGALIAHPTLVDLGEVIPAIVDGLSAPARFHWQVDADARVAVADAGLLERVLANITENALRYQPPGPQISIRASRVSDRVEIRVADRGAGVPEADQERIFAPFQRHGDAPAGDGLGLGLAVARGLGEAMGGRVEAEPTPGGGLTLVVSLPTEQGTSIAAEEGVL
jgi:two-component system, OmpR family, sensor histidine kinase KdpD